MASKAAPERRVGHNMIRSDGVTARLLRRATAADAELIASVWLSSRKASVPAIPAPVHSDQDVRTWVAEVLLAKSETWVALDDEAQVIGMMSIRDGWVDQLYVDPRHIGHGTGTKLLALAKHHYPEGLDLWTFQSNFLARHFYEANGFHPIEETNGDNEEGAPDVHYRWDG